MSKKVSQEYLSYLLKVSSRTVPPGMWTHKKSGLRYEVCGARIIDESTTKPMILYFRKDSEITWGRLEEDFLKNFRKD